MKVYTRYFGTISGAYCIPMLVCIKNRPNTKAEAKRRNFKKRPGVLHELPNIFVNKHENVAWIVTQHKNKANQQTTKVDKVLGWHQICLKGYPHYTWSKFQTDVVFLIWRFFVWTENKNLRHRIQTGLVWNTVYITPLNQQIGCS